MRSDVCMGHHVLLSPRMHMFQPPFVQAIQGVVWFLSRPLVLGSRERNGRTEWCVASEDCAFGPIGFHRMRDVAPGEMIVISGMDSCGDKG